MKRIIYIGGIGQSGSTILDTMLNQSQNIFGMGEVAALIDTLPRNAQCSCGQRTLDCPVWSNVVSLLTASQLTRLRELNLLIMKEKNLHRFLGPSQVRREYAALSDMLFEAAFY